MLTKLSLRNAGRTWKDYLVFFVTLVLIAAIMFSFNGLLFDPNIRTLETDSYIIAVMLGIATFFILLVLAWLIQYMIRFMMKKRSREFATYLLLGMKRRQITHIFWGESLALGAMAFLLGTIIGLFLRQFLFACFYTLIGKSYRLDFSWNTPSFLMTLLCFFSCYLLALLFHQKKFRGMNIAGLVRADRENECIREGNLITGAAASLSGIAYFVIFGTVLYFKGGSLDNDDIIRMIILLILSIYLLYWGLASLFSLYLKKRGKRIYHGTNLFLIRQLSSKIRTMRFTFGTLTVLFTLSLLGCSLALMLNQYQNTQLIYKYPFSVSILGNASSTMESEQAAINGLSPDAVTHVYKVYHNGGEQMRTYYLTHLRAFAKYGGNPGNGPGGGTSASVDSLISMPDGIWAQYYNHDPFMRLSDYNALRRMLGFPEAGLPEGGYLLQTKYRLLKELGDDVYQVTVPAGGSELYLAGIYTDAFCQDGHNGSDYILVADDDVVEQMEVYYTELASMIPGTLSDEQIGAIYSSHTDYSDIIASGTDTMTLTITDTLISQELLAEGKWGYTSISLPMVYIGLVYLCVALTILSVQQLSDSGKYRYHCQLLSSLGLRRKQINRTLLKQMSWFYLCPILPAVLISGMAVIIISGKFVNATGVSGSAFTYFGTSFLIFVGIYLLYFIAAYVGFVRDVWKE